jgi:hypothetical protein
MRDDTDDPSPGTPPTGRGRRAADGPRRPPSTPTPHPQDAMPLAELDAHARAEAALRRIAAGADPGREAFDLANTLNDEGVARLRARLTRWFRRR